MPYISQEQRDKINKREWLPDNPGELNYAITKLIDDYLCSANHRKTYLCFNEIIGVLECVKQEFYRRIIAPYEDKKKRENGDVFTELPVKEKTYGSNS